MSALLDKHVDVNSEQALDSPGNACLADGHIEIVKLLVDKGGDLNAWEVLYGLEVACSSGHIKIVKLFLDSGADVNTQQALDGLYSAMCIMI